MSFNLIMPMAGAGSRFSDNGYTLPKPLIEVHGKPMFHQAVENLGIAFDNHIFIIDHTHDLQYGISAVITSYYPDAKIISLSRRTDGAACSVAAARAYIHPNDSVFISNCDQMVEGGNWEELVDTYDAGMAVFHTGDMSPKWSYAAVDDRGHVIEVAEKSVISDLATVGHYWWKHAGDLFSGIDQMMMAEDRTNGEFYVCPIFNYNINDGLVVGTYMIDEMHGIGTPDDLTEYLQAIDTTDGTNNRRDFV